MNLDLNVQGDGSARPGFAVQHQGEHGLCISAGQLLSSRVKYGVTNDEGGVCVRALGTGAPGWTIYTFKSSGAFRLLASHVHLIGDVLVVGGGGSGGGGAQGGGGGAGGFIDEHEFVIRHGFSDGAVIVGDGGAEVPNNSTSGNMGGDSSFGGLVAYGGGYGSSEFLTPTRIYYDAADGGSGGGGGPWPTPYDPQEIPPWDAFEAPNIWFGHGPRGEAVHGHQGHWGHDGSGSTAYYRKTAGGGGGAWWPAYGGDRPNGGMGRPCDIAGWYQGPPTPSWMRELYEEAGWRWVPWFCGGGAGMERPNNWGYQPGYGTYTCGGGGGPGSPGLANSGGGGGGNGIYQTGDIGTAAGKAGGSGIVIIRIPTGCERLVKSTNAVITHIPAEQEHTDCYGEEEIVYYGWPDDHPADFPEQL